MTPVQKHVKSNELTLQAIKDRMPTKIWNDLDCFLEDPRYADAKSLHLVKIVTDYYFKHFNEWLSAGENK